jgi:glucose/arabinose dehydrogenase
MRRRRAALASALTAAILAVAPAGCAPRGPAGQSAPPPVATSTPATPSAPSTAATGAAVPATPTAWPAVALVERWSGLRQPLDLKAVPGGDWLAIVEQGGTVRVVRNGRLSAEPFLDIGDRVRSGGERGLLGIAFPPSYPTSGRFYVYYTAANGDVTISRFIAETRATSAVDARTEQKVLTIPHREFANHNGGGMQFGPDGYLYLGVGDGGSGGDPHGNGQNRGVLLAKLLRVDVEGTGGAVPRTYEIPRDNPYAGMHGGPRPEIWAYGLRNPWRFSFDRITRDLYIADVGQDAWEEVDYAPAGDKGGHDYGWNLWEGDHAYPPGTDRARTPAFTFPVTEYPHPTGESITGGYVYRGSRYPALGGTYYYGDFVKGVLWGLRQENGEWVSRQLLQTGLGISSFGEDANGELYVCELNGGVVYQLTAK